MALRAFKMLFFVLLILAGRPLFAADACVVLSSDIAPYREGEAGFKEAFRGKVDTFVMEGDIANSSEVASKVKAHKCQVVVVFGSTALNFLKLRITDKPIVYAMVLNPRSIVGSQKNITGVHLEASPEASLSAIHRIIPRATRIGLLYYPAINEETVDVAKQVAAQMKLEIVAMPVQSISDAVNMVSLLADRSEVIWMIPDAITSSQKVFETMLAVSFRKGVPLFALSKKHVSEGAVAALFSDYKDNGRQAARLAERIAQGALAGAVKDEHAAKADIVLNLATAKKLGIEIPKTVISEAVEAYK